MPFNLSTGEIVVLLIVAILVFGGRLPEVARKAARGFGKFRRGLNEEMRRIDSHTRIDDDLPPPDWTTPPDGADCDGFGRLPGQEETPDEESPKELDPEQARESETAPGGAPETSVEEQAKKNAP